MKTLTSWLSGDDLGTPASDARCSGPTPLSMTGSRICENLIDRIAKAEQQGWLGEVEGLQSARRQREVRPDRQPLRQPRS